MGGVKVWPPNCHKSTRKLSEMAIAALIDRGLECEGPRPGLLTTGLNGLTKTRLDEAKPGQQGQNHKAVAASESMWSGVYTIAK